MRDGAALLIVIALAIAIGALLEGCAPHAADLVVCAFTPGACN